MLGGGGVFLEKKKGSRLQRVGRDRNTRVILRKKEVVSVRKKMSGKRRSALPEG